MKMIIKPFTIYNNKDRKKLNKFFKIFHYKIWIIIIIKIKNFAIIMMHKIINEVQKLNMLQ
jgi:hypothetical protein